MSKKAKRKPNINLGYLQKIAFTKNGKIFVEPLKITRDGESHYLVNRTIDQDGASYQSHMQVIPLSQYNDIMQVSGNEGDVLKNKKAVVNAYVQYSI